VGSGKIITFTFLQELQMRRMKYPVATALVVLTATASGADADEMRSWSRWLAPQFYRDAMANWQPPETIRRLIDIAVAKPFPPQDPARFVSKSRFGWNWLKARFDLNHDGVITRQEFGGPAEFFDRLDRNHDGALTTADFDWSHQDRPMRQGGPRPGGPGMPGPGGPRQGGPGMPGPRPGFSPDHLFHAIAGRDGRISREQWDRLFDKLAKGKGYLTAEDLRWAGHQAGMRAQQDRIRINRLAHLFNNGPLDPAQVNTLGVALAILGDLTRRPPPPGKHRPAKFSQGPEPGQEAPDFRLPTREGEREISLADYRGRRPVVLVFGSVT
jgi:hypothetical protein